MVVLAGVGVVSVEQPEVSAQSNGWSQVPGVPAVPGGDAQSLAAVSCSSSRYCMALGFQDVYAGTPRQLPEVDEWDGNAWSNGPVPTPPRYEALSFDAVSCASPEWCVGVGSASDSALGGDQAKIAWWNGARWSVQTNPHFLRSTALSGVSCPSARFCLAVGAKYSNEHTGSVDFDHPEVEMWNGATWSRIRPPVSTGLPSPSPTPAGVSCLSARFCVVVGLGTVDTAAQVWNGSDWSTETLPGGSSETYALTAVSCTSISSCVAVGSAQPDSPTGPRQPVALTWDGSTWIAETLPTDPSLSYNINAVSCTSTTSCVAVGDFCTSTSGCNASTVDQTVALSWNGSVWSAMDTPTIAGNSVLQGVSCSSSRCEGVGYQGPLNNGNILTESFAAETWTVTEHPPNDVTYNPLSGVSCTSPSFCVAVGAYMNQDFLRQVLIEQWNGTAWTVVPSPNSGFDPVNAVSCSNPDWCVAVGYQPGSEGYNATFVETWDGTSWNVTPTPNPSGSDQELYGVSCTSSAWCVAVGTSISGTVSGYGLIETWNGTSWTIDSSDPSIDDLSDVSCASDTSCAASGQGSVQGQSYDQPAVEMFNGAGWSLSTLPPVYEGSLSGISCATPQSCTAVGEYAPEAQSTDTLVDSWDGTTWTQESSPNTSGQGNNLNSVSCSSALSCVATGSTLTAPFSEVWDGNSWTIATIDIPERTQDYLYQISCPPTQPATLSCTAVGGQVSAHQMLPLVESYS